MFYEAPKSNIDQGRRPAVNIALLCSIIHYICYVFMTHSTSKSVSKIIGKSISKITMCIPSSFIGKPQSLARRRFNGLPNLSRQGQRHVDSFSGARMQPRISKGITDLLFLNRVWLKTTCPSKKLHQHVHDVIQHGSIFSERRTFFIITLNRTNIFIKSILQS